MQAWVGDDDSHTTVTFRMCKLELEDGDMDSPPIPADGLSQTHETLLVCGYPFNQRSSKRFLTPDFLFGDRVEAPLTPIVTLLSGGRHHGGLPLRPFA
jgi:hypothetical protein